jgi:pimeloyl-ACP methyl ester carboxylesterase
MGARGIREITRVRIGGTLQGMVLEGPDPAAPVLLFLHGGPGMPEHWLTRRRPTGLDRLFTVCWWEQRGAGRSYHAADAPGSLTVDRLVADAVEVADHLRERFGRERIHLMAHSGGTVIGALAVRRAPERFAAYVGVAQMTRQHVSEREAWARMLQSARASGDRRATRRLAAAEPPPGGPLPRRWLRLRDRAMHRAGGGTTRDMRSVLTGIVLPSLVSPDYSPRERIDLWRGKVRSARLLREAMFAVDVPARVPALGVPVHLLHGAHDLTVSLHLARAWLAGLDAPLKGFYTFTSSAHSPILEEPARVIRILREDVLEGRAALADRG